MLAAVAALGDTERPTAAGHLHEALEAVARDLAGDPKATLGEVVKRNPDLLVTPRQQSQSRPSPGFRD